MPQAEEMAAIGEQRLSAIFEIARLLAGQHDLEAMLSRFLSCLIATLRAAETGILLLYEPEQDGLAVKDAQGYDLRVLSQIHIVSGEAMSGRALQSGQPAVYPDPAAIAAVRANMSPANRRLFEQATAALDGPQCAACVPLIAGTTRVGVLILENRSEPGHFREDLPFLEAVAQLIAVSIQHTRLREELQQVRALEEANRLKAELISTLAHEMRTPLTSIKGFSTALLLEEAIFDAFTQREFLTIIDQECDVLTDLIHDLLESSIIDAGLLRLELQPVRLGRLAHDTVEDFARRSSKHRFLVDVQLPIVDADPHRIEQVLRNLIDNAVKYSPGGGMIVIRGEEEAAQVTVSVSDQGPGIAPEHLNRLFDKFYRIDSGLGRHVVGSGLGLPIARTIVESHGGRIWAESRPGEGSTFYFTLPRPVDEE
jgi:signal transduction histidine kinase